MDYLTMNLDADFTHTTVLLEEAVQMLIQNKSGTYIDGTFGRGGHSQLILKSLDMNAKLVAFDQDHRAIETAQQTIDDARFEIFHQNFSSISNSEFIDNHLILKEGVDGILLDLGVSSPQLDDGKRGFSFMHDGPLDMRMNQDQVLDAAGWVNTVDEHTMADVFYQFGEERYSRRIANAVCKRRLDVPFATTLDLAQVIKEAHPKWEKHKHPATRCFQAIRIEINQELTHVQSVLDAAERVLKPGGRIVVISFHSLEDRLIKQFISRKSKGKALPRGLPVTESGLGITFKAIGKAVKPSDYEVTNNPRSRSAVMRVAEKL